MRLLIVEDDNKLAAILSQGLREEGYQIDRAADGEEALLFARDRQYEVIILDRMLPRLSGDLVLRDLRAAGDSTPVLMLTALDSVNDRVQGLTEGADDYLCKPFAFEELLARIQVLQRRRGPLLHASKLTTGELAFDLAKQEVTYGGRIVELTTLERRMLEVFLRRPGQVITRPRLAEQVWNEPWDVQENTIDVHVKNLRRKLEPYLGRDVLQTVRGVGYKWMVNDEKGDHEVEKPLE